MMTVPLPAPRVMAVVVSFHPELAALSRQLAVLAPQVERVIVVDNDSDPAIQQGLQSAVARAQAEYHPQARNLGLAAAQGVGIRRAIALGASHILLLDQDSLPADDMVAELLDALAECAVRGERVAGVGPRLVSARNADSMPFVRFRPWRVEKIYGTAPHARVRADFLVASGMLSPVAAYHAVGLPEEGLFIDNVDLEWCFRARSRGYHFYGVYNAVLIHRMGDETVYLPGLRRLGSIHIHDSLRQYYQIRNRFCLYGRNYCPWAWKVQDFPRALFKLLYFSLVVSPRWRNIRMMTLAVLDALRGVDGPCRHE